MVDLGAALEQAAADDRSLTLDEAGGPLALRARGRMYIAGPHLPLLVHAMVAGAVDDDVELRQLLIEAFGACSEPATFDSAVAALPAEASQLASWLVPVLLRRLSDTDAHIAACALKGAAGLAIAASAALPSQHVAVALSNLPDDLPEAVALAAVRTAGALLDASSPDQAIREAVETTFARFAEHPDVDVDVAVEFAHLQMVDALQAETGEELTEGLDAAVQAFESVVVDDPSRIDAAICAWGVRAALEFSSGSVNPDSPRRLQDLLDEREMYSTGAPDPVSRRARESGWGLLASALADAEEPIGASPWLEPQRALTLMVDAVRLSRAQRVGSHDLGVVVMPRLRAPFVEESYHKALLVHYAQTVTDDPAHAEAATALINAADFVPKGEGSGEPEALVGALEQAGLTQEQITAVLGANDALIAAARVERSSQWFKAFASAMLALEAHEDTNSATGQAFIGVLAHVLDFVADRFDLTRGSHSHLAYLKESNALEQALADDLVAHLSYWFGPRVKSEVSNVGGGRVDVVIDLGVDRIAIECKRDHDPWTDGTLRGWAQQANAYLSTSFRVGLLVLLDLADKAHGTQFGLAGSIHAFTFKRTPTDHMVLCAVVPGNQQSSPSGIGAAGRAHERKASRTASLPGDAA